MRNGKKIISTVLCAAMAIPVLSGATVFSEKAITVELDGTRLEFDVEPKIINGSTMVPLRKIFEEIGALVKWDGKTQTVSARKSSKTVSLTVDSDELIIDKGDTDADGNAIVETVWLEAPAQLVNERTLVPARAVAEAFGLGVQWDEADSRVIITSKEENTTAWKDNVGTIDLSALSYSGNGISIEDKKIIISEGGDYTLSGTLEGGSVTVSAKDKVKLRLNDASIISSDEPCIFIENADKAYITLSEGSKNTLVAESCESGAIYAKDNLEIKGSGELDIKSTAGHGIKASDNLTIENGVINLTAENDGIHINDTFKMTGGTVNISAVGDGIDSESIVNISGGVIKIETNGVPISSATEDTELPENRDDMPWGGMHETAAVEFEKSSKGINAEWMMCISGGDITVASASHSIHCQDEIQILGGAFALSSEYEKGISAHGNLTVDNSETVIDVTRSTEGLESKNILMINDGTMRIVASDDGINATGGNSGEMMMPPGGGHGERPDRFFGDNQNPGERIPPEFGDGESERKEPQRDKAYDKDFRNGETGEPMPPEFGDRPMPPQNMGRDDLSDCLVINGGDIEVFAQDDCLDSNGNIILNGGVIKAIKENGSFTGNNSVLDPDGKITVGEGVTLIAVGSGGMQGELTIPQNTIIFYGEETHSSGESVIVRDESGTIVAGYTPNGKYSAVLITSPQLKSDKDYTVSMGEETQTVTITSQRVTVGTQKSEGFGRRDDFMPRGQQHSAISQAD